MGAVGPQRVAFPADGTLPALPPKLVQNESSWLAFADLVFVDPVGTGFSRIIEREEGGEARTTEGRGRGDEKQDPDEYFGQKRDLESLCEFMSRWLSEHDRWGSPIFIAGESYGGYRVGRLVRMLQEDAGIGLNGAILISPALELSGLVGDDYGVVQWVDLLPTMAGAPRSTAAHAPSRQGPRSPTCSREPRSSRAATTRRSSSAAPRSARRSASAPSRGSPTSSACRSSSSTRAEGRVSPIVFARELLRDQRKVVGYYDVSITATDPFPDRTEHSAPDPTLAGISPAYTAAVNRQLRSEIGVRTDREYRLLSYEVNQAWKEDTKQHFFAPPEGATDSFRYGMALNPHMRAFLTHGRYDMATPYYASDRLRNLMRFDPDTTGTPHRPPLRGRAHVLRVGGEPPRVHGRDRGVLRGRPGGLTRPPARHAFERRSVQICWGWPVSSGSRRCAITSVTSASCCSRSR